MATLLEEPGGGTAPAEGGMVVAVAVSANLWRTYDYLWPESLGDPQVGQRIRVPLGPGNRPTLAFITEIDRPRGERKLKAVGEAVDAESQFDPVRWKLARWISRYYLSPTGMTLAAMIPSAAGRRAERSETVVFLRSRRRDWPKGLGPRQRVILDELLEARRQGVEPLTLGELLHHSEAKRASVMSLKRRGLVSTESRPVQLAELTDADAQPPFELNADQKSVLEALEPKLGGGFSATLIYGVTGSGKTEVYIRAIRKVVAAGKQAIVLVPEIALATQTLQRLVRRLPRVAVLHSALTDAQRALYFRQVRDGRAAVVVGPRSAVFAPAGNLGLIVVDEEHEPSYKQDNAPRYHGRDTAVMRASLAGVPVILGSATPSLESLHNVRRGRYEMLRLPGRVRGLPMPRLQIVHLRKEITTGRIELIGRTLTTHLAAALDRREQIILLMNRRGFASYVFCPSCKWEMTCDDCTRAMVFHRATEMVACHYCGRTASLPECCPACRGKLLLFGMGIQRVESELARKFPEARTARVDSDTMTSQRQFRKIFDAFSSGELDILLGTQMVAKGLDFPRVSLVGVLSADTSLTIPDFRAAERTFQLIVHVAGRAGRAELPGHVVVQTLHADEPAVVFATRHDYDGFASIEMPQRREAGLPPFARMMRFIVRHRKGERAREGAQALAASLRKLLPQRGVVITGPKQCGVEKIRGLFRWEILLTVVAGKEGAWVQKLLYPRMESLCRGARAEVLADVDPMSLM